MSDAVAALRALALRQGSTPRPLHVILADDLRDEITEARATLAALQEHRHEMASKGALPLPRSEAAEGYLGDSEPATAPTGKLDIDVMIDHCREVIESAEAEAMETGQVIVTLWRRVAPSQYQAIMHAAEAAAKTEVDADKASAQPLGLVESVEFLRILGDKLMEAGYLGTTAPDGEDLDIDLDALTGDVLNHADLDACRTHCITINRTAAAMDFLRASSGPAATR